MALIAIVLAVVGWFRPVAKEAAIPAQPTYTEQQVADATAKVCAGWQKIHHAIILSTSRNLGDDPTSTLAVATSGRQALDIGSRFLLSIVAEQPATPANLRAEVENLARIYQEVAVNYMAQAPDSDIQPLLGAADDAAAEFDKICK